MDSKQAAIEERKNMDAMSDPVFLTFTGFTGVANGNQLVKSDQKTAPGRILELSHLGKKYKFRAEDLKPPKEEGAEFFPARQMVPRHAAKHWIQDSLFNWADKVYFSIEEAGTLVPASEKGFSAEEVQARVDAALAAYKAEQEAKANGEGAEGPGEEKYTESGLNKMNKPDLAEIAAKLSVVVAEDAKKAELVAAILAKQAELVAAILAKQAEEA